MYSPLQLYGAPSAGLKFWAAMFESFKEKKNGQKLNGSKILWIGTKRRASS